MVLLVAFFFYFVYLLAQTAGESGKMRPDSVIFGAIVGLGLSTILGGHAWGLPGIILTAFGAIVAAGIGYTRGEAIRKEKVGAAERARRQAQAGG